mgnify:CR=1 FL=1
MVNVFIAIISGYLLGSIPSGYIAGRLNKNIDIRDVGSKNMGAINVYYEVGLKEAILVLLADVAKGIGTILLARWLGVPLAFQLLAGVAAVVGHAFPIFLKFRGGRGGATAVGILFFLMPKAIPFWLATCLIALVISRNLAFSYGIAFICFPMAAWLVYHSTPMIAFSIGLPIFVGVNYAPRLKETYITTGGNWREVIMHRRLKDRL